MRFFGADPPPDFPPQSPTETSVGSRRSSRPLPVSRGCSAQHRSRLASRSALPLCHQLRVRAGKAGLARGRSSLRGSQAPWFFWTRFTGAEHRRGGLGLLWRSASDFHRFLSLLEPALDWTSAHLEEGGTIRPLVIHRPMHNQRWPLSDTYLLMEADI